MREKIKNELYTNPYMLLALLLIVPPLGFAVLWTAPEDRIKSFDKKLITGMSCVIWIIMIVAVAMGLRPFFSENNKDTGTIIIASHTEDNIPGRVLDYGTYVPASDVPDTVASREIPTVVGDSAAEETQAVAVDPPESKEEQTVTEAKKVTDAVTTTVPVKDNSSSELVIVSITSSVKRGEDASITVQGTPDTDYSIKVRYKSGYSKANGLERKKSDSNGFVSWSWKIGSQTSTAFDPIITVSGGGKSVTETITIHD